MHKSERVLWSEIDADPGAEKQFYLEEFRGRTLLLAVAPEELAEAGEAEKTSFASVAKELVFNDTRLLVLLGCRDEESGLQWVRATEEHLHSGPSLFPSLAPNRPHSEQIECGAICPIDTSLLIRTWLALRDQRLFFLLAAKASREMWWQLATELAGRLRVHKLVLMEPEGGIADSKGRILPFMDAAMIDAVLGVGQAEWSGLGHRRGVFSAVRQALSEGVTSVNLCRLTGLADELFTYSGSGTLFTFSDYCSVERLSIDDFPDVERLLARGMREGVLKPRTQEEIAYFLLHAYGAVVGRHHLAGVCALETEPYRDERAGEVVGLYTITRFKGEGIGHKLLARVLADAKMLGLRYVFACTTAPSARAFFIREGFRIVAPTQVPATKWGRYPAERRRRLTVLRLDLDANISREPKQGQ